MWRWCLALCALAGCVAHPAQEPPRGREDLGRMPAVDMPDGATADMAQEMAAVGEPDEGLVVDLGDMAALEDLEALTCLPACGDGRCGDDGCGGSCGPCAPLFEVSMAAGPVRQADGSMAFPLARTEGASVGLDGHVYARSVHNAQPLASRCEGPTLAKFDMGLAEGSRLVDALCTPGSCNGTRHLNATTLYCIAHDHTVGLHRVDLAQGRTVRTQIAGLDVGGLNDLVVDLDRALAFVTAPRSWTSEIFSDPAPEVDDGDRSGLWRVELDSERAERLDPSYRTAAGELRRCDFLGNEDRCLLSSPNGIELGPQANRLYVNLYSRAVRGENKVIAYELDASGRIVAPGKEWSNLDEEAARVLGVEDAVCLSDGMRAAQDALYVVCTAGSTSPGVLVLDWQGQGLRHVASWMSRPTNVAFGGPRGRTLYVVGDGEATEAHPFPELADWGIHRGYVLQFRVPQPGLSWLKLRADR